MGRKTCRNLVIFRNTSKSFQLNFKDTVGNPEDITGWTVYFTVKEKMEDADVDAKISKDITSHYDATAGKTLISLTASDTNLKGNYYYDVKYKDDSNNTGILFHGMIKFREPVTVRG
jgi:hypothetical protein